MKLLQGLGSLFLAALLSAPAWASNNASSNQAVPGTLNYVEGQAFFADQPLDHTSIGKATLEVGQYANTDTGKAEILLTPGVYLREGDNTSVKLMAAGLENTELNVMQGHAMIEVDQIYPQNDLRIIEGNATARIMKPGLYDFDLQQNQMRVFDGEAMVQDGDKQIKLKSGHELAVAPNSPEKTEKFDKKAMNGDDLYRWSSLRSDYEAEANVDAARIVAADGWGSVLGRRLLGSRLGLGRMGLGSVVWSLHVHALEWNLLQPVRLGILFAGTCLSGAVLRRPFLPHV